MEKQGAMMETSNTRQGITPEVGKRYVTRGGWITPPIVENESESYPFVTADGSVTYSANGRYGIGGKDDDFDLVAEYVEPPTDTFRRDLIARVYVGAYGGLFVNATGKGRKIDCLGLANMCIRAADALIEAMEGEYTDGK